MAQLNKDLRLTADFVVFVRAGFYGQIIFEDAMTRLGAGLLPKAYLTTAHRAFDKMDVWMKDLAQGLPIFSCDWSNPETFDAISLMGFLKDLKRDLVWLTPLVEEAMYINDLPQQPDSIKLLAASFLRSAAVRHSYIETLYQTYRTLRAPDLAAAIEHEVVPARQNFELGRAVAGTFLQVQNPDAALCDKLRFEAKLTASDFRSHVHDANILLNVYAKEFTFQLAEIPRDEAEVWIAQRVPAVAAGYWRAYGFSPDDLLEWQQLGISAAPLAAQWRRVGMGAQDAISWIREGVPPSLAIKWKEAGFSAARAASMLNRGIADPAKAPLDSTGDNGAQDDDDGYVSRDDDDGYVSRDDEDQ